LIPDDSDFATIYSAYLAWRGRMKGDIHPGGYRATRDYCRSHYLSFQNLETIEDMKKQFLGLLVNIGFVQMNRDELAPEVNAYRMKRTERFCQVPEKYNVHSNTIAVINAAIAAALYPKFAFNARHSKKLIQGPKQEVANIHPSSIVYADRKRLMANFMVFNTITKSDKVYLWDVASVDDVIIMLFGGDMDILVRVLTIRGCF
jgi:ATP-dependent RNA helicase DHX29